jgi:molybdate transport system substrate-binding protein
VTALRPLPSGLVFALVVALHVSGCTPADEAVVEIRVAAAASLRDALEELAPDLERAIGARVVLDLGASSDLARQIAAADRADVFFSADEVWMDWVAASGLIDVSSRRSPLSNRLVVVVPAVGGPDVESLNDLAAPAVRRLALAHPDAVPAGRYARAWLESRGRWAELAAKVVPALDVRAALAAVASGAAEAGIVYRSDAATSRRVRVAFEVPVAEAPRIAYALAALTGSPRPALARSTVAWLSGPEAAAVFDRFGFVTGVGEP